MVFAIRGILCITLIVLFTTPGLAAQTGKESAAASQKTLNQYAEKLKKNPRDNALREKIIVLALSMRPAPEVPEQVKGNMARGSALAQKTTHAAGYKKAIAEFEAAANNAPWLALAYYNLGVVQKQAGLFTEAIQSLKFYLLAAPDAKNARDVKNRIYALEAEVEVEVEASAPIASPAAPVAKKAAQTGALANASASVSPISFNVEPEKPLKPIRLSDDPLSTMRKYVRNWAIKVLRSGDETVIQKFEIAVNANNELTVFPSTKLASYALRITAFEITGNSLKLQFKWRLKDSRTYWKMETYGLTLSEEAGKPKLSGSYTLQNITGQNETWTVWGE